MRTGHIFIMKSCTRRWRECTRSALSSEEFVDVFDDVSPVGKDLAINLLNGHVPPPCVLVVHIGSCKTESHDFPAVVAQEVELEAVAPSRHVPAVSGNVLEHFVETLSGIVTYGYRHNLTLTAPARCFFPPPRFHLSNPLSQWQFDKRGRSLVSRIFPRTCTAHFSPDDIAGRRCCAECRRFTDCSGWRPTPDVYEQSSHGYAPCGDRTVILQVLP